MPVDEREINSKVDTSPTTSIRKLLHIVALGRSGINRIIIGGGSLEHTETVVMLGGDDDGAHTGFLGQCYNLIGIELHRVKFQSRIAIPVAEDTGKGLDLFAISEGHWFVIIHATIDGIKSEVDKHRELVLVPFVVSILCYLSRCTDADKGNHQEGKEFFHDNRLFI